MFLSVCITVLGFSLVFFVFLFVTSLLGSCLTLKISLSISKSLFMGGQLWDFNIHSMTIYFTLGWSRKEGFVHVLCRII